MQGDFWHAEYNMSCLKTGHKLINLSIWLLVTVSKRPTENELHITLSKEKAKQGVWWNSEFRESANHTHFHIFCLTYVFGVCVHPHMCVYMCWIRMKRISEINIVVKDLKDIRMEVASRTLFISPGSDKTLPQPQLQLLGQMQCHCDY